MRTKTSEALGDNSYPKASRISTMLNNKIARQKDNVNSLPLDSSFDGVKNDYDASADSYKVKFIPSFSASSLKMKKDKEYSLWLCLRALNYWGSGILSLDKAITGLCEIFNYGSRTAKRHLSQGDGSFWGIFNRVKVDKKTGEVFSRATIKIYGLKEVGIYLNTLPCYRPTTISASEFQSLKQRRAQIYASIFNPLGFKSNPISRKSIQEKCGLPKYQQIRYQKEAKIKRTANFQVSMENGKVCPVLRQVHTKLNGYLSVHGRVGNIYHTRQLTSPRGQLHHIRKRIKNGGRSFIFGEALPNIFRRFFSGVRKLVKCKHRAMVSYYLLSARKRLRYGRLEWLGVAQYAQ